MSNDSELILDTSQLIASVSNAEKSMDGLLRAVNKLATGTEKSFKAIEEDSIDVFKAVKSQLQILSDSIARVNAQISTEDAIRLRMVSQNRIAIQNQYETMTVQALAEGRRLTVGQLEEAKFAGASLLAIDKKRLADRAAAYKAAALELAAQQATAERTSQAAVKLASIKPGGDYSDLNGRLNRVKVAEDFMNMPSKADFEFAQAEAVKTARAFSLSAQAAVKLASIKPGGDYSDLNGRLNRVKVAEDFMNMPSKADFEFAQAEAVKTARAFSLSAQAAVKLASIKPGGDYSDLNGRLNRVKVAEDFMNMPSKADFEFAQAEAVKTARAFSLSAQAAVKLASIKPGGDYSDLNGRLNRVKVAEDFMNMPSKADFEFAQAEAVKTARAFSLSAQAAVKLASIKPGGDYSDLNGRLNRVKVAEDFMNMPSKADFEVAQAKAIAQTRAFNNSVQAAVRAATLQPEGNFSLISTGKAVEQGANLSKLGASLRAFTIDSNDAHSAARGLAAGFGGLFLTWGAMVPLLAGSAVSYSFAAIVRSGAEVQNTLTQIGVLAGATNTELQGLSGQLLSMAKSGPFGPKEIAEAMKTLSLAGLDATKVALALPEVLNFSVAGTTSLKTAADTLTTVGTAFSISAANYGYISDVISKAAAESKSSIEGMSEAFKTASVISQQYGVSLEDTAISLALLANAGISGTAAGTAMRNMFVDLSGRTPKVRAALTELKVDALDAFGKMRGQAEIFKDVMVALSEYKPKAQSRLIQEIFSERGAKDAIAIMTALKQQATDTAGTVTTVYDDLAKKMQESAGFSAIAAAQMALTPLNEMKSVGATLEAVFVETFTSIQPYITDFATSLKATFNSTEFKSGIKDLAVSFATVTKFLIDHAGTIGDLVLGYFAFKGAVTLLGGAFVLLETYSLAAASGLTATAIAAKLLTNSTPILAVLSGVVAIGAAAWGLYATNSSKASTATDTYVGSSATQLLAKLDDEYDRLVKINTARITGITLQEAEAKAALENARNSKPEGVEKLEKELASVKARKDAVRDPRSIGPKLTDSANLEVKLQSQIDKLYSEQGEKLLLIEQRTAGIVAIRQQAAEAAKAETLAARNSIVSGNKDFNPVDKAAAAALAKQVREEAAAADKRIAADIKEYDDRFKEAKSSYDSQQQILDNAHKNKLLSEGAYQAEQVIGMVEYNSTVEKLSKESNDKVFGGIVARGEKIEKQLATGKITTEEADNAYSALDITWTNFARKLADADTSRAEAEIKRLAISAQNAEGKIVALRESVTTFWKQDAIDAAASVGKISYAVDEFTIAMEGAANTANAKYEKELIRLTQVQEDAYKAVVDFKAKLDAAGGFISIDDKPQMEKLQKFLGEADKLVREHGQKAADGVATAMSTALESAVRQAQKRVVTSIADAILLGITDGAESGVKAFRKILEQELVTKPFRIMLEAALTGNGGTGGGILGSTISTLTQGASSLGSSINTLVTGGNFISTASKWFSSGSGSFGDTFVNAIKTAGETLVNNGYENLGLNTISAATTDGLGSTIAQLGDGISYLNAAVAASEGRWGAAIGSLIGGSTPLGPLGSAIGNFIGGIVDRGFGGGGEYTTGSGIQGTLANSGSTAQTWQSWYNPGSWWGQSSNGRNVSSIDQKAVDSLAKVFISTKASVIGFGEALGKNTSGVLNYSRSFSFDTGGSAAANKSAIEGLLKTIADEMAAQLITTKYQKEGERLGDTLARLATNLTSVNAVMFLLDKTALSLSETGAGAASELVDLFGSLDAFTTASKNYYDLFFTAEEKHADTTAVLAKSFAKLNLAMPLTNAGFRALVESLDIANEADRATYVSLMELSTAFASLTGGAGAASAAINVLTGLTEGDFATRVAYERFKGRLLNGESTTGLSGIPGFASGGSFDGGWRIVGENGPELEHTGPSSIYNNSQSLFDTTQLVAELQALRLEVSNLRAETRAIVSNTTKSVKLGDKWDTEGMPAVRA